MSAHTPGPWWVSSVVELAVLAGEETTRVVCEFPYDWPNDKANARLIAAAPDLLEALQELLPADWRDGVMDHMPGVAKARAAIAKATQQ